MKIVSSFLVMLAITTTLVADPQISGSVISWPDDGWYQVQRTDDFTTVCEGGTSCSVDPGSYFVINHTTGERFDAVVANAANPVDSNTESIQVVGNTISWPDDGWYSVQTTDDYTTLCQGGRDCQVAPGGSYTVINHSTGQRFENILLGEAIRPPHGTEIPSLLVSGNNIIWTVDGWHQVQNSSTYETVCEGERDINCEVEPGVYIVINHLNSERIENVQVPADPVMSNPGNPVTEGNPVVEGGLISWLGSGYFQLQSNPGFRTFCEGEIDSCQVPNGTYQLVNHTSGAVWNDLQVTGSGERPVDDDGSGSELISNAQRARLPADCLLDVDSESTAYCFSSTERRFMAVTNAGEVRYDYPLPGSNETNDVQALVVSRDSGRVCIVADITQTFGNSTFEISCFTTDGAFIETWPALRGLPRYGDPIKRPQPFAINLDGEPLRARSRGDDEIAIQGTLYSHNTNGSAGERSSWTRSGDFVAAFTISTGELLAWQDYGQQTVTALGRDEFFETITVDGESAPLVSLGYLPNSSSMNLGELNPPVVSAIVPHTIRHLHGSNLEFYANEIDRFAALLVPELTYPVISDCVLGRDIECDSRVEATPIQVECEAGGSLTVTPFSFVDIPGGSGRTTSTGEVWDFDACSQPLDEFYNLARVNGRLESERSSFTSVQFDATSHHRRFNNLRYSSNHSQVTMQVSEGELRNSETIEWRGGQTVFERVGTFSEMYWHPVGFGTSTGHTLENGRVGRAIARPRSNTFYQVRDPYPQNPDREGLGFTISLQLYELDNLQVSVTESFSTAFSESNDVLRVPGSRGELSIVSPNGDSVTARLQNSPVPDGPLPNNFYGDEEVFYTINYGGIQYETTKPSASLYAPWHTP